jgi:hypothetical protein
MPPKKLTRTQHRPRPPVGRVKKEPTMATPGHEHQERETMTSAAGKGKSKAKPAPTLAHLSDHFAVDTGGQAYTVAMGQVPQEVEGVPGVTACVLLTPIEVQVVETPPTPTPSA